MSPSTASIATENLFEDELFACFEALYAVRDGAPLSVLAKQLAQWAKAGASTPLPLGRDVSAGGVQSGVLKGLLGPWQYFAYGVSEAVNARLRGPQPLNEDDLAVVDAALHRGFECLQGHPLDETTVAALAALTRLQWPEAQTWVEALQARVGLERSRHPEGAIKPGAAKAVGVNDVGTTAKSTIDTQEASAANTTASALNDWDGLLGALDDALAKIERPGGPVRPLASVEGLAPGGLSPYADDHDLPLLTETVARLPLDAPSAPRLQGVPLDLVQRSGRMMAELAREMDDLLRTPANDNELADAACINSNPQNTAGADQAELEPTASPMPLRAVPAAAILAPSDDDASSAHAVDAGAWLALVESVEALVEEGLADLAIISQRVPTLHRWAEQLQQAAAACVALGIPTCDQLLDVVARQASAATQTSAVFERFADQIVPWTDATLGYLRLPNEATARAWALATAAIAEVAPARVADWHLQLQRISINELVSDADAMAGELPPTLPQDRMTDGGAAILEADAEWRADVVAELQAGVVALRQGLLAIKQQTGGWVEVAHRVHTLKGALQTADWPALAWVLHAAESVLAQVVAPWTAHEANTNATLLAQDLVAPTRLVNALTALTEVLAAVVDDLRTNRLFRGDLAATYRSWLELIAQPTSLTSSVDRPAKVDPPALDQTINLPIEPALRPIDELGAARPASPAASAEGELSLLTADAPVVVEHEPATPTPAITPAAAHGPQLEFANLAERAAQVLFQQAERGPAMQLRVRALRTALQRVAELTPTRQDVPWFTLRRAAEQLCVAFGETPVEVEQGRQLAQALREAALAMRYEPLATLSPWFERTVAQASKLVGKSVGLTVTMDQVAVERATVALIRDTLIHVLRNAVDHGIESAERRRLAGKAEQGEITLSVRHLGGRLVIECHDDGAGIDEAAVLRKARALGRFAPFETPEPAALWRTVLEPGFTTRSAASMLSGRGMGLDIVAQGVRSHGGDITLSSEAQHGTRVQLNLPLRQWVSALLVLSFDGLQVAFEKNEVVQALSFEQVVATEAGEFVVVDDSFVPVRRLRPHLALDEPKAGVVAAVPGSAPAEAQAERVVLIVRGDDGLLQAWRVPTPQELQLVCEAWPSALVPLPGARAAAILPDGHALTVLDAAACAQLQPKTPEPAPPLAIVAVPEAHLRDDAKRTLLLAGWSVRCLDDGMDALALARRCQAQAIVLGRGLSRLEADDLARVLRLLDTQSVTQLVLLQALSPEVAAPPYDLRTSDVTALSRHLAEHTKLH